MSRRPRTDAALPGLLLFAGFAAAGVVVIVLGWRTTALEGFVPLQAPAALSAGVGGLVLAGIGLALLELQLDRRAAARRADAVDALLDEAVRLVAVADRLRDKARSGGQG